jgi:hypothetical protein
MAGNVATLHAAPLPTNVQHEIKGCRRFDPASGLFQDSVRKSYRCRSRFLVVLIAYCIFAMSPPSRVNTWIAQFVSYSLSNWYSISTSVTCSQPGKLIISCKASRSNSCLVTRALDTDRSPTPFQVHTDLVSSIVPTPSAAMALTPAVSKGRY